MALPTTREETAAPGALVKSATVNAIQDAIIALHGRVRGANWRSIGLPEMACANPTALWRLIEPIAFSLRPMWMSDSGTGGGDLIITVPLEIGARVLGAKIYVWQEVASVGLSAGLVKLVNPTSGTSLGASSLQSDSVSTAAAAGFQVITLTGITPAAIAAGENWYVAVHAEVTDDLGVGGAEIQFDHPL